MAQLQAFGDGWGNPKPKLGLSVAIRDQLPIFLAIETQSQ